AAVDDSYKLGIGDFTLDFSDVQFPVGTTHVKAQLGIGELDITVPDNVTVIADAHATGGQVTLFEREADGGSVDLHNTDIGTAPARVLELDTKVTFGEIRVLRG